MNTAELLIILCFPLSSLSMMNSSFIYSSLIQNCYLTNSQITLTVLLTDFQGSSKGPCIRSFIDVIICLHRLDILSLQPLTCCSINKMCQSPHKSPRAHIGTFITDLRHWPCSYRMTWILNPKEATSTSTMHVWICCPTPQYVGHGNVLVQFAFSPNVEAIGSWHHIAPGSTS